VLISLTSTVPSITPRRPTGPTRAVPRTPARPPFRDNPRLILLGVLILVAILAGMLVLASRTTAVAPELLTEAVLYALCAADLTMLAVLLFVLARNIVKLIVERRRAVPFAHFRTKLVALLLGMTLIPALLVLAVGSELIRTNIDRWFNARIAEVVSSASQIAGDYYAEREARVAVQAQRLAAWLSGIDLARASFADIREHAEPALGERGVQIFEVFRVSIVRAPALSHVASVGVPALPFGYSRAAAETLAAEAISSGGDAQSTESLEGAGDLLRAAAIVRGPAGQAVGVVVATDQVAAEMAGRARGVTQAFENYNQLRVLRRPLTGVYLSGFLMMTLLILMGSLWMGLYLAKRVTRPVQALATAARAIGAGKLDQRVEVDTTDEFGSLADAFNAMARELASSRRKVDRSTFELERKHGEVEARRRYIETVLERVATGVVSVDGSGAIMTINTAAARLLSLERSTIGHPAATVFDRPDLQPLKELLSGIRRPSGTPPVPQEIAIERDGHEVHLAAVATPLAGEAGAIGGAVLVLDDVTPLIRAQKVAAWREVARRLAHEIKNPLTPIQLSAERLRRHFADAPPPARELVDECTSTIVGEVESLKGLVDEFSQFARMPAPRTVPTEVHQLIIDTLALYDGIFADIRIERKFAGSMPLVRIDAEQIRRVIINLVDNAIEAMERRGCITVSTQRDAANNLVRVIVADDGPGIPPAEREKLFLPYYSTKRRGSGLGLAIVRRIIAEHGGSIDVGDNTPRGTRFTIELPC